MGWQGSGHGLSLKGTGQIITVSTQEGRLAVSIGPVLGIPVIHHWTPLVCSGVLVCGDHPCLSLLCVSWYDRVSLCLSVLLSILLVGETDLKWKGE